MKVKEQGKVRSPTKKRNESGLGKGRCRKERLEA